MQVPPVNEERVARRVAARQGADEVFELIRYDEIDVDVFLAHLAKLLKPEPDPEPKPKGPSLASLGATVIHFGKHAGISLDRIDPYYLEWLCQSQEDFLKELQAYLKHPDRRG